MSNWNAMQNKCGAVAFAMIGLVCCVSMVLLWVGVCNPLFEQIAQLWGMRLALFSFVLAMCANAIVGVVCGACLRSCVGNLRRLMS